jgi:hypothetical protein
MITTILGFDFSDTLEAFSSDQMVERLSVSSTKLQAKHARTLANANQFNIFSMLAMPGLEI